MATKNNVPYYTAPTGLPNPARAWMLNLMWMIEDAEEIIEFIETKEPGWSLCKIYDEKWYSRPMRVSAYMTLKEAKRVYECKDLRDPEFVPTRVYLVEQDVKSLRPEDRYNPWWVYFSVNHKTWDHAIHTKERQAEIRKIKYTAYNCPNTDIEWSSVLHYCVKQSGCAELTRKTGRKSPYSLLSAFHFVKAEVQMINCAAPSKDAIFELRYSFEQRRYFYNCYYAGVKQALLKQLLEDSSPIY